MKRIMSDRGMGKTTSLLNYAKYLAKNNPTTTVFFICANPGIFENPYIGIPNNIKFLSVPDLLNGATKGRNCKVVIDEVEMLLEQLKIDAYTLTLSDTEW